LRKPFIAAGAAALALGAAGIAYAQNPAPSITVTTSVTPTSAGTKTKPKATTFRLKVTNDPASKTTASQIAITFPSTLKLSTKGLPQCTKSDDAIINAPKTACKSSIAGKGTASAILNPNSATPAPLAFKVTPIVGKNELLFYLEQTGGVKAVLHGKISGKKLTIQIPAFLQQPVPGTFSALNDLDTTIKLVKGKNSLISSTGCKAKAHKIGVTIGYVPNPSPPASASASGSADAKCS
jgi:hypothetical protein